MLPGMSEAPDLLLAVTEDEFLTTGRWWQEFDSSNVLALRYDPEHELLQVTYKDGRTWEYGPVDRLAAHSLAVAPSKGTWVWDHIKVRGTVHQHQVPHAVQVT